MASRDRRRQRWSPQPLTPLMEGPDLEMPDASAKKESSWEVIREWFRVQRNIPGGGGGGFSMSLYGNNVPAKGQDLRLLLGVLGCPLAPIPVAGNTPVINSPQMIKTIPIEASSASYIIQQYLAATGCLKMQSSGASVKNMYTAGAVKMICCETEVASPGNGKGARKSNLVGTRSGENGCFVLWQMSPGMWSLELAVGAGHKVIAGSDGKIVWRHTPWLGTHAAKGPQRPLRRIIQRATKKEAVPSFPRQQGLGIPPHLTSLTVTDLKRHGLDPKSTASLFTKAQCLGEKRIGDEDCFVLKVVADVRDRNEGAAEVLRHVLYGYFSQKSGLLVYMEDSHLTRVQIISGADDQRSDVVYWETTIGSSIGDYRDVDGVLIAHRGRTIATVFRFEDEYISAAQQAYYCRTRLEEIWRIDDVVFNVPGLSVDSFIPPADIFHSNLSLPSSP